MTAISSRSDLLKKISLLEAITEVSKTLVSSLDQHQVLTTIISQITKILGPSHWALYLLDETQTKLEVEIAVGMSGYLQAGQIMPLNDIISDWVLTNRRPLLSPDFTGDARFRNIPPRLAALSQGSLLAVPLLYQENCLGYIELVSNVCCSFGDDQLAVLLPFADITAIAITNCRSYARLERINYQDDCTTLYNARYLQKALNDEVQRCRRYQRPLSCIFFDLDHFKLVNDSYGHLVGTALLQEVAAFLQQSLRTTDLPFRYGGDEFVVLLPETALEGATLAATRLLAKLQEHSFLKEKAGQAIKITASFGVSTFSEGMIGQDLISLADQAMYYIKNHGRSAVKAVRSITDLN